MDFHYLFKRQSAPRALCSGASCPEAKASWPV